MNEDELSKVLDRVVPEAPSPDAWAADAVRTSRRRRRGVVAAVAALAVIAVPVGATLLAKPPLMTQPAAPAGEVTGNAAIFGTAAQPELCLGAIAESYPPQCSGPALKGDFDWAQVEFQEASGVRWTDLNYTVRGFYDPDDGERGSFTLTAPVVVAPVVEPEELVFPQLCEDPYAGGGSPDAVPEAPDSVEALTTEAAKLELVNLWVSDGQAIYNVQVQGDADAAFQKLRAVWKGGLCVQSSDAPTEARRMEVVDAVQAVLPAGQLLTISGGGIKPELEVQVVILTPEIEAAVRKAAEEVPFTLTAVFTPVDATTPSVAPTDPATPRLQTLTGSGVVQQLGGELPRLCLSIAYSDPIHCEGPILTGDFAWDGIPSTEKDGVRTSDGYVSVTGEYDPADGDFGSLLNHEPPIPAGMPGVEFTQYSTLCGVPDAQWPDIMMGDPSRIGQDLGVVKQRACERLTGPVDEAARDALVDSLRRVAGDVVLGLQGDGNDVLLRVVYADDDLLEKVGDVVEDTGMPVAVRTALTPVGGSDTTLVVPSR